MDGDEFKTSLDELRDLDLGALLNIDVDGTIKPVLRLEDLENIDWSSVVSSVLGVTDPIGQLRDFLASLLSGFVDTIKNLFTAVTAPIADFVNRIWSVVSAIPGALSQLMDAFRSVVLDPIRNAIQFALDALGKIRDLFANLTNAVTQAIQSIPGQVSSIVSQISERLQSAIDNIKNALGAVASAIAKIPENVQNVISSITSALGSFGNKISELLNNIVGNIARIPQAVSDMLSRVTGSFSDFVGRVQSVFSELLNRLSQIPQAVGDATSKIVAFMGDLANKARDVLIDVVNKIGQIPGVVADALNKLGAVLGDVFNKVQKMVQELAGRIAQIPAVVGEVVGKIGAFLGDLVGRLQSVFGEIANRIQQGFGALFDAFRQASSFVSDLLNRARDALGNFINGVVQQIQNIPNALSNVVRWLNDAFNSIASGFRWVLEQIQRLPDAFGQVVKQIVGTAETAGGVVLNAFKQIGDWIQKASTLLHQVAGALMGFVNTLQRLPEELWRLIPEPIKSAFQAIYDFFTKTFPEWFRGLIDNLSKAVADFARDPLGWFQRNVIKPMWDLIPEPIKSAFQAIYDFFTKTLPEWFRGFIEGVTNFFRDPLKWIEENVAKPLWNWFQENIIKPLWDLMPEPIKNFIEGVRDFFTETLPEVGKKVFDEISKFTEDPGKWIHDRIVKPLWDAIPQPVKDAFEFLQKLITERLKQALETLSKWWEEFSKDPVKWLADNLLKPVVDLASKLSDAITSGVKAVLEVVGNAISAGVSAVRGFIETVIHAVMNVIRPSSPSLFDAVGSMLGAIGHALSSAGEVISRAFEDQLIGRWVRNAEKVEEMLQTGFARAEGIGNQMWWIGSQLMMPYWQSTVVAFALRGLAKTLGHFEVRIEPQVAGSKMLGFDIRINVGELLSSVAETLPSYAHAFAIGSSFAIAQLYLQNIQSWYVPRVLEYYEKVKDKLIAPIAKTLGAPNAIYNAFVRIPSENEMLQWAHRWISAIKAEQYRGEVKEIQIAVSGDVAPREMSRVLDTIKLHLYYFGLPKWYVEFMAQDPDKFYIAFEDRFGAIRKIPLSPLYELPTHGELARMTQRDIFPSVKTMQAVSWVRGWNEDISTMIYLLTFKYPSFEKLWEFYMRATAGMLWFSPPGYAKAIFESEAEQVQAGKPISPLDIQNALASRGAQAMQAFETALNLYLKWLEYSNFSWITPNTKLQGVNVGQLVYSALGGWVADSWLMWDVAADIPTKIDMRWMSKYGIFLHMASRIGEDKFATYTPMVTAVKSLLDSSPASKLTVELQWFSKLLQATGMHPAWVPIVTVAENIMVISDEMTLLRTGWINLFKEGLLTFDVMDKALDGLFTVSYKVGHWNPETKQWTTGWINLPVRWLPHERRLLEYRALIDRIMDLYREFYGYMRSAVRTLVLTPEEAKKALVDFVKQLDAHYSKIAIEITGQETHLRHDVEYLDVWLNMFAQLGQFEAMERARIWWQRVSGWLLYRIAYGYVDVNAVAQMLQKLKNLLKLSDIEMNAYLTIVEAVYNIIGKERVPTPWQMTTLAEYMMVPDDLIKKSIDAYNVDEQYRDFLYRYVKLRPIKLDYRELIIDAIRALRANKITKDVFNQIVERARDFGFTEPEIQILKMRGEFLSMVYEDVASKSVRVPTPWQLATLAEYMAIPQSLVAKSIDTYGLDSDFAEFVARYIVVKSLKADYRQVITSALRALRYGVITREVFNNILKNALNYGFTEPEVALIQMRAELDLAVDSAREYIPTPTMLATMAEVLPEVRDYATQVFETRRIRGVWAELWAKYIYLRPVIDEVRRWLNAVVALVERNILPMDALYDVFKILSTYGYEQLEQEIITRVVLSNKARHAWNELLGTARNLATMSRYSDVAADMAWTRVAKIIDALPVDNQTKDLIKTMWKQYIIHYQNYPEIRSYVTELVTSYAYGVIDDDTFNKELQYLKQLGVPEMTLALIRRRAQLRRMRVASTRRQRG
jgi:phage-related protein